MPLAPVDEKGTQLYYEDSGAPVGSRDYKTLVMLHGGLFHGAIFKPLFPFAAKHNMRLVALNARDYHGSSPFSDSELAALDNPDLQSQQSVLRACGRELAAFLVWFIKHEQLPLVSGGGGRGGGISVLGWSFGSAFSMSFLAQAGVLSEKDRTVLGDYMQTVIILDPSRHPLGIPSDAPSEQLYDPLSDAALTPEQKQAAFSSWISGYYKHEPSFLDSLPTSSREQLTAGLPRDPQTEPSPTLTRMSAEELAGVTDPAALAHSTLAFTRVDPRVYEENMQAALWDKTIWPRLRIALVWCDASVGPTMLASWYLANMVVTRWPAQGRRVELVRFEGANHFPHWDKPEDMVRLLARIRPSTNNITPPSMPLAPVDDDGTQLYYEDTGAPENCPGYRTLVLVHGAIFNGATFKLMFPHAAKHGIRLVTVNMRDYRGSTPYTDADIEALGSGDPERQQSMIRARGLEIAAFLVWFIRKEDIPPYVVDGDRGGLSLLGWSWGNVVTMAFLAQASGLSEDDGRLLDGHLKSFVIFDSARQGLGVPAAVMEGLDSPGGGTDMPAESDERWLSWAVHHAHSKPVLDAFPLVTMNDMQAGVAHSSVANPLPQHKAAREHMVRELGEIIDPTVIERAQRLYLEVDTALYGHNVRGALLDASTWPCLQVYLVWCDASMPETVFSNWYLAKQTEENWPRDARSVKVVRFEDANHFPHWYQPEDTMALVASLV
ncbi:Alpha/Beta hydrolase protein [Rhodofomes roseus]|uniref:Alpha/Beta hydrolase protein n=1 Tax=Rhodofomes roseus TaxID=34475 RepID=A0ABQ8KDR4_9APHY|nr:Alpha/Beta hydrolase protein [Rhodofomes roseus]KAH9835551.1 Alpha/Beta hydrolase protein [Rhodofomes roseus]